VSLSIDVEFDVAFIDAFIVSFTTDSAAMHLRLALRLKKVSREKSGT